MCTLESWSFLEFSRGVVLSRMFLFAWNTTRSFVRVHQNKPLQQQTPTTCLLFISSTCCFNQSKCRMTRKVRSHHSVVSRVSVSHPWHGILGQQVLNTWLDHSKIWYPKISQNINISPPKRDHFKRNFHLPTIDFQGYVSFWGSTSLGAQFGTYINPFFVLLRHVNVGETEELSANKAVSQEWFFSPFFFLMVGCFVGILIPMSNLSWYLFVLMFLCLQLCKSVSVLLTSHSLNSLSKFDLTWCLH